MRDLLMSLSLKNCSEEFNMDEQTDMQTMRRIVEMVETLEQKWKEIFSNADKKILKAQKHQAKGYNRRHSSGTNL